MFEDAEDKENFKYEDYEVISEAELKEKAEDYLFDYIDNFEDNITDSFIKPYLVINKYDFVKRVLDVNTLVDILGIDYKNIYYDELYYEDDYYYVFNKDDINW